MNEIKQKIAVLQIKSMKTNDNSIDVEIKELKNKLESLNDTESNTLPETQDDSIGQMEQPPSGQEIL